MGFVADVGDPFSNGLNPNPAAAAEREKQRLTRKIGANFMPRLWQMEKKMPSSPDFREKTLFKAPKTAPMI